jgi:hypothetical protein
MLVYPTPTETEAMDLLLPQAIAIWGDQRIEDLEEALKPLVRALVALSAFEVPEDTEPLFP